MQKIDMDESGVQDGCKHESDSITGVDRTTFARGRNIKNWLCAREIAAGARIASVQTSGLNCVHEN